MKGVLAGIQTVAVINFTDDQGHVLGSVNANISNELAFKLHVVKRVEHLGAQIDRAVNASVLADIAHETEPDAHVIRVRFNGQQLRSGALIGHSPREIIANFGEALNFPKKVAALVNGVPSRMTSALTAGQMVEFVPLNQLHDKVNQTVSAPTRTPVTKKPGRPKRIFAIGGDWKTVRERNKLLLHDRNQGMSGRELAKKYKLGLSTVYGIQ